MKKLLIVASFFLLFSTALAVRAEASTVTVSGDAWSDNYGWINFKGPTYGVSVDTGTDLLQGQAWSDKLGWISFSTGDLSGCPTTPCNAKINLNNGKVTGWAKLVSLGQWIHLSPDTGSAYGITYDKVSLKFSGQAWSDYAGWISFRHDPDYVVKTDGVITSQKILAPTINSATPLSPTSIRLDWTNNDTNQNGNALERSLNQNSGWATTTTNIAPNATTYTDTGLIPRTTYFYRMVATSPSGNSDYSNTVSTTTLTTATTISVSVSPSNAGWTIRNDKDTNQVHMTGNQTITVTPSLTGTTYTITGDTVSNYDWPPEASCDYGDGQGVHSPCSKLVLTGGQSASFILSYNCIGSCVASNLNYSLSPATQTITINKASITQYGSANITKTFLSGSTGFVDLNVTPPAGNVPSVSYSNRSCSPTCTTTVQFGVDPSVAQGDYTFNFAGSPAPNGAGNNLAKVTVHVSPPSGVLVICKVNPTQTDIGKNVTWSLTDKEGGTPPYVSTDWLEGSTVVASGDTFTTSYPTNGRRTLQARVQDSAGNIGYCSPVQVQIGTNPGFGEF